MSALRLPAARRLRARWPAIWLATALALSVLLLLDPSTTGGSPFRALGPLMLAAALAAVVAGERLRRPRIGPRLAYAVCAASAWIAGMLLELTLSADGDGLGGMHGDTRSSFLLAQGWYVPAALLMPALVRRLGLDRNGALLVGASLAVYEVALTAGPLLLSPAAPLGLLVAAYIAAIYAMVTASGVLALGVEPLRTGGRPPVRRRRAVAIGLACGVALWAIFMGWALLLEAAGQVVL